MSLSSLYLLAPNATRRLSTLLIWFQASGWRNSRRSPFPRQ